MNVPSGSVDDIPLAIDPRMKWLVNNQRFADVTFVVGEEKQIVYAQKGIIASGSPVFERMFFANHELQMTGSEPIEIPDLTATGFINMLKYIYTNALYGLDLSELFETFVAGDKYQVYNMNETMFSFIKAKLTTSNCCIIYDQLMKFPSQYVCVPLGEVKSMIRYHSASAFKNEYFVNIDLETLVDLLKMDALAVDEIDVLKSCAKWVAAEVKRLNLEPNAANKQETFKPIKKLIEFSKIPLDQLKNFSPIKDLLSIDELGSLLLHHLNVSTITIECNATRKKLTFRNAFCKSYSNNNVYYNNYNTQQNFSHFSPVFKANRDIILGNIHTFLPKNIPDVQLSIIASERKLELNYRIYWEVPGWNFQLIDFVKIDAEKDYKFEFTFKSNSIPFTTLSCDTAMITTDDKSLRFNLSSLSNGYHCLKQIDFYESR